MGADYRNHLRRNLATLMSHYGKTTTTLKARYTDGTKRGELVSPRSIRYMLSAGAEASSPSLDMLAAVAAAFNLHPAQLLVPELDPENPPVLIATEAERRLYAEFKRLRANIAAANSHK